MSPNKYRLGPALLRFVRDRTLLALLHKANNWIALGNRSSAFARQCRTPGRTFDERKADDATTLALAFWRAADSLKALVDLVFGKPEASELPESEFVECAECAAKPGSPSLCPDCLRRRAEHSARRRAAGASDV